MNSNVNSFLPIVFCFAKNFKFQISLIFAPLGIAQTSLALLSLVEKIDEFNALTKVCAVLFLISNFSVSGFKLQVVGNNKAANLQIIK